MGFSRQESWSGLPFLSPVDHILSELSLGPRTDFPTWGSGKGIENPQRIWLWRPVGFDSRTSTGLGKQNFEGTKKPYVYQDPGERSSDPTRDWARFACECPGVSRGGMCWQACCRFRGSDHKTLATCLSSASWQDLFLKEVAITISLSVMYNSLQPHWL